jgi:hypothetical protein
MAGQPTFEVDLAATRRRISRLRRYVQGHLLTEDREFICPHLPECAASVRAGDAFREGTMSHLGRRFDVLRDGRPLRVVVVGQESGWARGAGSRARNSRVSLAERYATVVEDTGLARADYAHDGLGPRNPHMRGTTSALRVLFGTGLGSDPAGEYVEPVNGRRFHIFDGFALVNRLLCSAGPANSSQGRSTGTMRDRCAEHFQATLGMLEPTIVVLQGAAVRRWTEDVLVPARTHSPTLYTATVGGHPTLVCAFSHPAAHGPQRWGDSLTAPYLTDIVVPTLQAAVGRL